jgi:hypothetical protein
MKAQTIKMIGNALKIGKSSLQVINSMKLENNEITLTDLDTFVTIKTDISGNGLISFDHFKKTFNVENSEKIQQSIEDYPKTPKSKSEHNCMINYLKTSLFSQSYKNYLPFCSQDATRETLRHVFIGPEYSTSTDGHRLIIDRENRSNTPFFITPEVSKVLDIVLKTDTVRSAYTFNDNRYLKIKTENYEITSKIDFGPYPNVEQVIPKINQKYVELSIDQIEVLKKSLEKIIPYTNEKTNLIKMKNNTLYVNNRDRNLAVQIVLPFNITPYLETIYQTSSIKDISVFSALEIGINGQYFLNNLKELKTGCKIGYRTAISAITFETENSIDFLVMPLRILAEIDSHVTEDLEYIEVTYKNLELPTIKPVRKPAKKPAKKESLSGFYLFNVQSLYGITEDINMPNIVKQLTTTEYKAFLKLNVSKLTSLTV